VASNRIEIDTARPGSFAQNLIGRFFRGYGRRLTEAAEQGTRNGLGDVMDEWKRLSADLAPLDKGTLRRGIHTEVDAETGKMTGAISVTAVERNGGRNFDYATYIHDVFPKQSFANPTTAGTIPKFLDKPLEQNAERWKRDIEDEIRAEMRRRGF
jgi:hypothetical protein